MGTEEQIREIHAFILQRKTEHSHRDSRTCTGGTELSSNTILTTYTRRNGKVYINGHKHFISGAQDNDYCLTLAKNSENPEQLTLWFVLQTFQAARKSQWKKWD